MVLTTGRMLEHWHTGAMTRRATVLDHLEPEAVAHLAPAELERMHIEPGAPITVETRRGTIGLRARADAGVSLQAWSSSRSASPRPPATC